MNKINYIELKGLALEKYFNRQIRNKIDGFYCIESVTTEQFREVVGSVLEALQEMEGKQWIR